MRSVGFVLFAGATWALLPLVARFRLGLGSAGYGLLPGCVGLGAVLAATFGPALKRRLSNRQIYLLGCLMIAVSAALLAISHSVIVAAVVLVVAGAAWIIALGVMSTAYQGQLPAWVKARSFAYYLIAFQGANGIGALCLGGVAQATSVSTALLVVAGGLIAAGVLTLPLPLPGSRDPALLVSDPLPLLELPTTVQEGPVSVSVRYRLAPGADQGFLTEAVELRRLRRRTGAVHWHLQRDLDDPMLFTEQFIVGSWDGTRSGSV